MSRSSHPRHQMIPSQQQISENDGAARAAELFDHFCVATTMRQILGIYRGMCDAAGLRAGPLNDFYPKLKAKIRNWKAQALWKKFDARAAHRVYCKGNAGAGSRVLVIGAGPCGLRTAIEAQLLGAKVVVVEKRDRISRNNVLHLWPFLITDLRNLGAKKFYGKFCAGSIDHISIRQLQCILLKVALLLGVEVHEGVSFIKTVEPSDGCGWRAHVSPEDHAVSHYEFDVLIGADGKRNTLEGFKRKEFRGKLAIAITANFINKKTEAEAKAEEISGVAFIFNQSFFKELYQTTGIDLENVVYYKDETHYFVMTAKKHSLLDKGVIIQDFADPAELLAPLNVNTDKLLDYAREAAEFSTKYQMPNLEFAVNHYGKPDVAMFDFTSMFAAEASCRAIVKKNYRLLQCLVGDSLLEPFWPTGSGCARGFLSSMDAAYAIKLWSNNKNSILGVLAQRESIYRLLAQTTPENLQRDIGAYTVDPATRYPNLNKSTVNVWQVKHLLDTDDPALLEQTFIDMTSISQSGAETPIRRKRRTGDTLPLSTVLLRWIKAQLHTCDFVQDLTDLSECFTKGQVLCALINRYRPDLVDLKDLAKSSPKECNELAFKILEVELGIPRALNAKDSMNLENIDSKIWLNYLEQVCEVFRGEIPHIKYFKLDFDEFKAKTASNNAPDFSRLLKQNSNKAKPPMQEADPGNLVTQRRSVLDDEKAKKLRKYGADNNSSAAETTRRPKKRRSHEKSGNIERYLPEEYNRLKYITWIPIILILAPTVFTLLGEERQQRLKEIESNRLDRQNKRRLHRFQQTQNFYKSLTMLQLNTLLRESDSSSPFEDYSIYMYRQQAPEFNDRVKELERKLLHPDRERGLASSMPRSNTDEHFNDRIKHMEQRITSRRPGGPEKKPKDLLRAIGKIESTDWNIREIEKKIEQSKKTELQKSKEKVPRWSKEQFLARQNKMAKPLDKDEVTEEKFKTIDQTLKNLDKQLKEGSLLEVGERGKNKVASIAGQLSKKADISDEKPVPEQKKANPKAGMVFTKQAVSEKCHFCKQTVYLMEKISTEGLILHRSCLKCHHCHTNLRLGGYAFDRDDPEGRFYCTQHFRLPAKAVRPVSTKRTKLQKQSDEKERQKQAAQKSAEQSRTRPENVAQLDLLDRGQTPERIEFENVDALSDGEPSLENIIDENEWTDRNFPSEGESSNNSSSDSSDEDSDSDMFEEANGSPLGAQTLQLATDWIGKQRYNAIDDSDDEDFYDSSEGLLDDETDSQTEGEEFKKAREMRRQEVKVKPPLTYLLTDTDTEVHTVTESSPSDEVEWNSATEISTDSEFDHDPIIRETPSIFIDDTHIRKPTKVQIRQGIIANNAAQKLTDRNNENIRKKQEVEFKPLIQVDPLLLNSTRMPLKNPRPGDYLLNKAPSTEGIASKKSLELKKRYLLGEQGMGNGIMKSGSTSILDSKLKSFHSNISECQKLLNPGSDISPTMKTFLDRTKIGSTILSASGSMEDVDQKQPSDIEITRDNEYCETIRSLKEFTEKPPTALQTIDLVSPEKELPIIDLTSHEIPSTLAEIEQKLSESIKSEEKSYESIIDLTQDTPEKKSASKEQSSLVNVKPDISKDLKETIPDVISQIGNGLIHENTSNCQSSVKESSNTFDAYSSEKESEENDQEALLQDNDVYETSIKVPNIQWDQKNENDDSDSLSNSSSSSLDDIPHFILESTTSPDTQNGPEQIVPQVQVHDTSGTLMQIDSLMIIDGKYVGDPEDLRHMEIPKGTNLEISKTSEAIENLITQSDKPDLKFDTKNENKIDTLKHLPMILEKDNAVKVSKPNKLDLDLAKHKYDATSDTDRTPTLEKGISDSETEVTGQVLTETELSDWAADDCVSENFVDIEFALNSNKGTIRRNKKGKKKLPQCEEQLLESISKPMSSQKECSILTNLDIEEIEFMDTGSEGSCIEAYCATNKAMLQNRGYIEFVDQNHPSVNQSTSYRTYEVSLRAINIPDAYKRVHEATNKEIPGIDYIEQGACILSSDMDAKTPVNEPPSIYNSKAKNSHSSNASSQQTDSLNDIDEDSLVQINSHDAITTTNTTTTEESDALTIVTSPADVFSVKVKDLASTPSSSDKNEKTVECQESTILVRKSSPEESRKRSIQEDSHTSLGGKRKDSEECSYEEYVRKLQMKITQISNARDSIDIRKQKRKSSKGDISHDLTQSSPVIEKNLSIFEPSKSLSTNNNNSAVKMQTQQEQSQLSKLVDSPPISRKLEEITKERTKQKDLIHDLVMNKLQSKKQLNAEKRLNRSRNRSLFSPNGYSIIPELQTSDCANSPHYHVASSVERPIIKPLPLELVTMTSLKLSISPIKPKIRAAMFTNQQEQRPFSVNLDNNTLISPTSKISNIKSFCSYTTSDLLKQSTSEPKPNSYVSPVPPPRTSKKTEDALKAEMLHKEFHRSNPDIFLRAEERDNWMLSNILNSSNQGLDKDTDKNFILKSAKSRTSPKEAKNVIQLFASHIRPKERPLSMNLEGLTPTLISPKLAKTQSFCFNKIYEHSKQCTHTNESNSRNICSTPVPPPRTNKKPENLSANKENKMKSITRASHLSNPELNRNLEEKSLLFEKLIYGANTLFGLSSQKHMKPHTSTLISSNSCHNIASNRNHNLSCATSDLNSPEAREQNSIQNDLEELKNDLSKRRKSLRKTVSNFFQKKKDKETPSPTKEKTDSGFSRFRISPKSKNKSKDKDAGKSIDHKKTQDCLKCEISSYSSSPQLFKRSGDVTPPPIPPLPLNYQRSDDESFTTESREHKKQRAISKASRQAELKRLRIAQEIQREQEEIEVKLKELEARGVLIEKALRGEGQNVENLEASSIGASDEKLLKELLEIWRNITQLKKRDEELGIRQKELQLEHRHAQLKEELNTRLSCSKLDKSSADVAAEGAILNEMLEIVAKRAALRSDESTVVRQSNENDPDKNDVFEPSMCNFKMKAKTF